MRTEQDFQDFIDKEFGWRIKEIDSLKASARTSNLQLQQSTIIRAGQALLYAHWEGFVKAASTAYLEYVSNRRLQYQQLKTCFLVVGAKQHVETLIAVRSADSRIRSVDFVLSEFSRRARFSHKGAITTKSNLNSEVLADILLTVGLRPSDYETKKALIDVSLVSHRNKIAHGEFLEIDAAQFFSLADEVIILLRQLKNDLENSVSTKAYRR